MTAFAVRESMRSLWLGSLVFVLGLLAGCGGGGTSVGVTPPPTFFDGVGSATRIIPPSRVHIVSEIHAAGQGVVFYTGVAYAATGARPLWRVTLDQQASQIGAINGTILGVLADGRTLLLRFDAPGLALSTWRDGVETPLAGLPADQGLVDLVWSDDASVIVIGRSSSRRNAVVWRNGATSEIPESFDFIPSVIHQDGVQIAGQRIQEIWRPTIWDGAQFVDLDLPPNRRLGRVHGATPDFSVLVGHTLPIDAAEGQQAVWWAGRAQAEPLDDGEIWFVSRDARVLSGYSYDQFRYAAVWSASGQKHRTRELVSRFVSEPLPDFKHHQTASVSPDGRDHVVTTQDQGTWLIRLP